MNSTQIFYITIPLGREAHAIAEQFATQQATPQKGKQVYLNTLAVYAVHCYLKWLQIETNLDQSDSWHPIQVLSDAADLWLPGIGRLECCPVLPGETSFQLSSQAIEDRIGCIAVQFNESLEEVKLLGFTPSNAFSQLPKQLSLTSLQPLDVFLDYVDGVPTRTTSQSPVKLNSWIENTFEAGWQAVETLFSPQVLRPAFQIRSKFQLNSAATVRRGKLIDLGTDDSVALIVTLLSVNREEMNIRLQVYPASRQMYLLPNLHLTVLDDTGITFPNLEATASSEDICLQLEFSGQSGERFSVRVTLGNASITEDFLI